MTLDDTKQKNLLNVTIKNSLGLHLRPAAQFVELASKYKDCELKVTKDDIEVNGKSIMGIMMLAAGEGSELTLEAEGKGCEELLDQLAQMVKNKFGEE